MWEGKAELPARRRWGCRRAQMCSIGRVRAVLHIRPGSASNGSAESCGNTPALNAVEILPCAEVFALHMGARTLETSILVGIAESRGKLGVDPRVCLCPMCSTTARAEKNPTHSGAVLRQDPTGNSILPALRRRAPPPHRSRAPVLAGKAQRTYKVRGTP